MRCLVLMLLLVTALFGVSPVHADGNATETIAEVLERSQDIHLQSLDVVGDADPRAQAIRASFRHLQQFLSLDPGIELRVVRGPLWAETIHGRLVVANLLLADLPEGERLFVLAHELGHIQLRHWAQMTMLFQHWIPGPVTQDRTDAIADPLGRDASALSYRQEFEADAYAGHTLRALGIADADVLPVFSHMGAMDNFATHPSADQRIAALHALGDAAPASQQSIQSSLTQRPGTNSSTR